MFYQDRRQPIRLDRAAEKFSRRKNVLLAHKLIERAWAHAAGERGGGIGFGLRLRLSEKVVHVQK